MMRHIIRRIYKLGMLMGYLVASGAGGFVFTNGFRMVARVEEGSDTESSLRIDG